MPKNINSMNFQKQSKQGKILLQHLQWLMLKWHTECTVLATCTVAECENIKYSLAFEKTPMVEMWSVTSFSFSKSQLKVLYVQNIEWNRYMWIQLWERLRQRFVNIQINFRTLFRIQDELLAIFCNWGRVLEILGVEFWRGVFDFIFDGIHWRYLIPWYNLVTNHVSSDAKGGVESKLINR